VATLRPDDDEFHIHVDLVRATRRFDADLPVVSKAVYNGFVERLAELTDDNTNWAVNATFDYGVHGESILPLPIPMPALSSGGRIMEIRGLRFVLLAHDKVEYQIIIDRPGDHLYHAIEFVSASRLHADMLNTLLEKASGISQEMVAQRTIDGDASEG